MYILYIHIYRVQNNKYNILSLITRRFCLNSPVHDHRGRSLKFDAQCRLSTLPLFSQSLTPSRRLPEIYGNRLTDMATAAPRLPITRCTGSSSSFSLPAHYATHPPTHRTFHYPILLSL